MVFFSRKQPEPPRRRRADATTDEHASEHDLEDRYTFRRNRTLTGSASSHVSSLSESTAHLKSPRVQAHELAKKRRHIGLLLLGALAAAALLYGLLSQFTAGVAIVPREDYAVEIDHSYEEAIQEYLTSQPLERLRFMTNSTRLTEYVQSKAPEVEDIQVDGAAGFGASRFVVTMRRPIAGWTMNGVQAYVDATGTAFTRNYYPTPAVKVTDNSGVQVEAGHAVASNRFLGFVGRVVGLAGSYKYKVTEVIIPAATTRQVELKLEGVAYPVKFSVDRGAGVQMEDMSRAIRWLQNNSVTPEYLDVRVSGRAFYR